MPWYICDGNLIGSISGKRYIVFGGPDYWQARPYGGDPFSEQWPSPVDAIAACESDAAKREAERCTVEHDAGADCWEVVRGTCAIATFWEKAANRIDGHPSPELAARAEADRLNREAVSNG